MEYKCYTYDNGIEYYVVTRELFFSFFDPVHDKHDWLALSGWIVIQIPWDVWKAGWRGNRIEEVSRLRVLIACGGLPPGVR